MTFRLVFEARIKPGGTEEQYIQAWRAASAVIQQQPGAMGTRLHRREPGVLVAIATWDSKTARDAAVRAAGLAAEGAPNHESVVHAHLRFADVTSLFGLEEIDGVGT